MPADLYPHKSGLGLMEPIALIGQNVAVLWSQAWSYHKVSYVEPIPPFQFLDIGAVVAQTVSNKTPAPNLEVDENEFAQFRWYPIDNAQVRLYMPEADGRYRLRQLRSIVDMNILNRDPCLHLTEFFVWENNRPWFEAINLMDYALVQCRIMAMGYRFEVEDMDPATVNAILQGREPCARVVCQGQGLGKRRR